MFSPPPTAPIERSFREAAVQYANTDCPANVRTLHFDEKPSRRLRRVDDFELSRSKTMNSYTLQKKSDSVVNLWQRIRELSLTNFQSHMNLIHKQLP